MKINSNYNYSYKHIKELFKEIFDKIATLQPTLTAGEGITINAENEISTDKDLTPLTYIEYNENNGNIETSKPIIETMGGYSFHKIDFGDGVTKEYNYVSVCRNGNKLTFVVDFKVNFGSIVQTVIGDFTLPSDVFNKLIPKSIGTSTVLDTKVIGAYYGNAFTYKSITAWVGKLPTNIRFYINPSGSGLSLNTDYYARYEVTFLLSDNMVTEI